MTISWGSIGFDGAAPMLRKKEPSGFNRRRICPAHSPHQSKYDRRSCRSEYRLYLIPRLYGGEVTASSTLSSASRDIPAMQSFRRRSNLVTRRNFASVRVSYKRVTNPAVLFLRSMDCLPVVVAVSAEMPRASPVRRLALHATCPDLEHSRIAVISLIFF